MKVYLVKSEYEVEDGYIDIALLKQVNLSPKYFAIFELKYISKKEYAEKGEIVVKERLAEAKNQLERYHTSEELSKITYLKKWAIVFGENSTCYFSIINYKKVYFYPKVSLR